MIDLLPLDKVREEDAPLVGENIVNLAKLANLGFPVEEGLVVCPPEVKFRTILKHYDLGNRELFEQSLEIIKAEFFNIESPSKEIPQKVWTELLGDWIQELRTNIWRGGLGGNLGLSAQIVFPVRKVLLTGQASLRSGRVIIESEAAIDKKLEDELVDLIKKANQKLFLPFIYNFLIDQKKHILLTGIAPYIPQDNQDWEIPQDLNQLPKIKVKSSFKVFLDLSEGLEVVVEADGILVCSEKIVGFDQKVWKLVETAQSFPESLIIFKLSDLVDQKRGVRGSLRLIHQPDLLKEDVGVLLFARNTKKLINISVAVPFVRSQNEFLQIKRDLAVLGASRKGSLKLWLECSVAENMINIEDYLTAGLDGLILNLDELSQGLGGFDLSVPESIFYQKQVSALIKFLEEPIKKIHKSKILIIALGSLALHDEVLKFLVEKGVFGVVADLASAKSFGEHLQFLENRLIRSRVSE